MSIKSYSVYWQWLSIWIYEDSLLILVLIKKILSAVQNRISQLTNILDHQWCVESILSTVQFYSGELFLSPIQCGGLNSVVILTLKKISSGIYSIYSTVLQWRIVPVINPVWSVSPVVILCIEEVIYQWWRSKQWKYL